MSIFIFSGKDMYRQEERLSSLLAEYGIAPDRVTKIDASDKRRFDMEYALMQCDSYSLFDEGGMKAVILQEPFFLNGAVKESEKVKKTDTDAAKRKKEKEQAARDRRIKVLEDYLKHPNRQTMLIFFCHVFDADSRKKEYKLLTSYGAEVIQFDRMKPWDFEKYAKEKLRAAGMTLDAGAMRELLERVDNDTLLLHNAIVKLDLYDAKRFTQEDISNLVPLNPEVNVFRMSNVFLNGDLKATMRALDEMVRAGIDYPGMIAMLASRLRSLYNMKKLYERGYSEKQIVTRLHAKEYAVKKGLEGTVNRSSGSILKILDELACLDQDIKTGKADPKEGFEVFLLKNGGRYAGNSRTV